VTDGRSGSGGSIDRRSLIRRLGGFAGGAAATAGSAAPGIAEPLPALEWRLTSSFPRSLLNLYPVAEEFARRVLVATEGRFRITVAPPGEIAAPFEALDAVRDGHAEMAQTASYYYTGKDPAFAFGTAVPFGLNSRQQNAWMYQGGGIDVMNALYGDHGVYGLPAGNTGAQMGGWFRKEITSVADLKGLRMRIPGLGAATLQRLGVETAQLSGVDAAAKLAAGEIDAAEWVGPFDDLALGLHKSARYYYHPSWWEGCGMVHLFINLDRWNALPKPYQAVVTAAAAHANAAMQAGYDASSPAALRTLVAEGAELRTFPQAVLNACFAAASEVFAEKSAESAHFRRIFAAWKPFRREQVYWFRVAEGSFDNRMAAEQRAGRL
jgi:TRAP-type mannitol/chloroaromatic compound transport system substrate-binding protein